MDTKLLVNPHKIRSSIKRLFTGTVTEILGELLQNSQRAGATEVSVTTDNKGFRYRDNGSGLEGVEGFYKMLSLGDSGFEESVLENQEPMGIGFGSLLAHEEVSKVTITSNGLSLEIDTKKWWDNEAYYSNWEKRLKKTKSSAKFNVEVKCEAKVTEEVKKALPSEVRRIEYWIDKIKKFPAIGYKNILEIKLNNIQVETGSLDKNLEGNEIISSEWVNGNKLTIYEPDIYSWNKIQVVNWYGQLIKCQLPNIPFCFVFEVRNGKPLNPKAPVREGFIEDKALASFAQQIEETLFQELCQENTSHATAENIKGLYKLNPERADNECPYVTAAAYMPYEFGKDKEWEDQKGEEKVFRKEKTPLLINHKVRVVGGQSHYHGMHNSGYYHGVSSFIEQIQDKLGACPYELTCKSTKTKGIKYLIWKPGKSINNRAGLDWFYSRGEFCLTEEEPKSGSQWQPSDTEWYEIKNDVFAFSEPSNWDIESVDWLIGCNDPIEAVEKLGWAGFDHYNDEAEEEELRLSYEESIDIIILRLSPPPPADAISRELRREILAHLERRLGVKRNESIGNIVIILADEEESMTITGKKITANGEEEAFSLVAKVYE